MVSSTYGLEFPDLDDSGRSFRTYRNYLVSFDRYLVNTYGNESNILDNLRTRIRDQNSYRRIQSQNRDFSDACLATARKILFNTWYSELSLQLPMLAGNNEIVCIANHWAPVQGYYSIHLAAQAFFEIDGCGRPTSHRTFLTTLASRTTQKSLPVVRPWSVVGTDYPSFDRLQLLDRPSSARITRLSNLKNPEVGEFWSWYSMWLRTTRERDLADKVNGWKKNRKRKNIPKREKAALAINMPGTTIFDCLYRLRIRSNYRDADAYIVGGVENRDALEFSQAYRATTLLTLFVIEEWILARSGEDIFRAIASRFIDTCKTKVDLPNSLNARVECHLA